ncbi:hypothetical protein Ccrd_004171 [Cynara cardunculus var. scolymus]|uniref:Uncharacterized protein n=1 Tax=Cynara cardunculus var. scolymus TaxID=59895 RepID=A0A103XN17_CYNCS|nr:hypothetical protein Ccrd_004171 [Cynara cardunculus var. scolymus]
MLHCVKIMCNIGLHDDHHHDTVCDHAYLYGDTHHTDDQDAIDGDDDDDGDYDYAPAASMEGDGNDNGRPEEGRALTKNLIKMSYVAKTIRGWSFKNHADGYSNGNDGYYNPASAKLQRDGDDDDADYDYAPAAISEANGDDDDADYDYAPAASEADGDDDDGDYDYAPAA